MNDRDPTVPPPGAAPTAAREEVGFLPVFTLVLWLICLAVGLLGLWLQRQPASSPAAAPAPQLPPVQAQLIEVVLTPEPLEPPADQSAPPDAVADAAPPDIPQLPAVAAPGPSIAFSLPVEGPVRIVSASLANHAAPRAAGQRVRRLTYGFGEGVQPKPQYPTEAQYDQEEGAVGVRFTVATDGHVVSAEVSAPCRWPLLNRAAADAVRRTWRFSPGPVRVYEVSITFKLNRS